MGKFNIASLNLRLFSAVGGLKLVLKKTIGVVSLQANNNGVKRL